MTNGLKMDKVIACLFEKEPDENILVLPSLFWNERWNLFNKERILQGSFHIHKYLINSIMEMNHLQSNIVIMRHLMDSDTRKRRRRRRKFLYFNYETSDEQ